MRWKCWETGSATSACCSSEDPSSDPAPATTRELVGSREFDTRFWPLPVHTDTQIINKNNPQPKVASARAMKSKVDLGHPHTSTDKVQGSIPLHDIQQKQNPKVICKKFHLTSRGKSGKWRLRSGRARLENTAHRAGVGYRK